MALDLDDLPLSARKGKAIVQAGRAVTYGRVPLLETPGRAAPRLPPGRCAAHLAGNLQAAAAAVGSVGRRVAMGGADKDLHGRCALVLGISGPDPGLGELSSGDPAS